MKIVHFVALTVTTLVLANTAAAQTDHSERPSILRKNKNLAVTFSGRLHRMVLGVDDGANTDAFFTDSEQGPTMLRFDVDGKASDALSIGAIIETGIRQNRPLLVSQDKPDGGTDVTVRIAEVFLKSTGAGRFALGRGFAAAWLAQEISRAPSSRTCCRSACLRPV